MAQHENDGLVLRRGVPTALPHTLSSTRHLSLTLTDVDPDGGTATLELHNPEATHDEMVAGLVEEHLVDVESANKWRDRLHLPEKPVPVDVSTMRVARVHVRAHEKLQIGDRTWTVSEVAGDRVTLEPGHDHEVPGLVNEIEDAEYDPAVLSAAQDLNVVDEGI